MKKAKGCKHRRIKESIVKKLFRTYLAWTMMCIFAILCGTVLYVGHVIDSNVMETQRQLTLSINQNIENYLQDMDSFSMELVRSEEFQELVQESLPAYYEQGRSTADLFSQLYSNAYKMIQNNYQVGVVSDKDYYIWMGNEYYIDRLQGKRPDVYKDYEMDGGAVVKYAEKNEFLEASKGERKISGNERPKITLARSFGRKDFLYNGSSILEVQMDAEEFERDILRLASAKKDTGLQIHILNADGESILSETEWDARGILENHGWKAGTYEENGDYIYVYQIFHSEIYVVYKISLFDYYNQFLVFLGIAGIVFLVVVALMIAVSYYVSRKLTRPIRALCTELENVDLARGRKYQPLETDIYELDYLSKAIEMLNVKLEESMGRIIAMRDYENHARMLALQAQMQPHFFVNTLTTMGTMASQSEDWEVARMCTNLTQMFRYISAEAADGVRFYEEIKQVDRYVEIMKERFPKAVVEIDIPLEMMNLKIPKLTIQPLMENSFKYCNRSRPVIRVSGSISREKGWSVKVTDNGEGFSEEKAAEILKRCEEVQEHSKSLSVEIDGMGLVNVYARLQLFYKEDILFRMSREGIEIGGRICE